MDLALTAARDALERGEVPVGCAIYSTDGKLLVTGSNRTNERGNATAHAELIALEALAKQSDQHVRHDGLLLFVTCEPCVMCAAAIVQCGKFARIEYGCANSRFGGCGSIRDIDVNCSNAAGNETRLPVVAGGVRAAECIRLLSEFYTRANPNAPCPKKRRVLK